MGASWGRVGGILWASWAVFGRPGGVLGVPKGRLGLSWRVLGGSCGVLGGVFGRLRASWGRAALAFVPPTSPWPMVIMRRGSGGPSCMCGSH